MNEKNSDTLLGCMLWAILVAFFSIGGYYFNTNLLVSVFAWAHILYCFMLSTILDRVRKTDSVFICVLAILDVSALGISCYYHYAAWIFVFMLSLDMWTIILVLYLRRNAEDKEYNKCCNKVIDEIMWGAYRKGVYTFSLAEYRLIERFDEKGKITEALRLYGNVNIYTHDSNPQFSLNEEGKKLMRHLENEALIRSGDIYSNY